MVEKRLLAVFIVTFALGLAVVLCIKFILFE